MMIVRHAYLTIDSTCRCMPPKLNKYTNIAFLEFENLKIYSSGTFTQVFLRPIDIGFRTLNFLLKVTRNQLPITQSTTKYSIMNLLQNIIRSFSFMISV